MFAGKTEELIRRVKRAVIAKQHVLVFKPIIDDRYGTDSIVSHASIDLEKATGIKPEVIDDPKKTLSHLGYRSVQLIVFDEAQFFDKTIMIPMIGDMIGDKKRVVCAGLDLDAFGVPFGGMPEFLSMADEVVKLKSICVLCQDEANRTYRKVKTTEQIVVGGAESYESRCYKCWRAGQ
jgi:thymidine kinase